MFCIVVRVSHSVQLRLESWHLIERAITELADSILEELRAECNVSDPFNLLWSELCYDHLSKRINVIRVLLGLKSKRTVKVFGRVDLS